MQRSVSFFVGSWTQKRLKVLHSKDCYIKTALKSVQVQIVNQIFRHKNGVERILLEKILLKQFLTDSHT